MTTTKALSSYLTSQSAMIGKALEGFLPALNQEPFALHEAMHYSVLGGGKRIRPALMLAVAELLGGDLEEAMIPACAVELIHCYSLIHDDLPCMDDDHQRRGKPTCHVKYGESTALLAGDAIQTLAFQLLGTIRDQAKAQRVLTQLAKAAGSAGMVGGQALDLAAEGKSLELPEIEGIHILKTGKMIKVSCLLGAIMSGVDRDAEVRIDRFGEYLGFAFQIVDDILDGDGIVQLISAHEARAKAEVLIQKAKAEIRVFKGPDRLTGLADLVLNRQK